MVSKGGDAVGYSKGIPAARNPGNPVRQLQHKSQARAGDPEPGLEHQGMALLPCMALQGRAVGTPLDGGWQWIPCSLQILWNSSLKPFQLSCAARSPFLDRVGDECHIPALLRFREAAEASALWSRARVGDQEISSPKESPPDHWGFVQHRWEFPVAIPVVVLGLLPRGRSFAPPQLPPLLPSPEEPSPACPRGVPVAETGAQKGGDPQIPQKG